MEDKKPSQHLTVADCFYRYLNQHQFSRLNPIVEIANELGVQKKLVTSWAASKENFPKNQELNFWKLAHSFRVKGFCPLETIYFRPQLRVIIELLFRGVHIDDILRAVEKDFNGLIRLLKKPRRLTGPQAQKISFLKSRLLDREEVTKLENEILDLMQKLEQRVARLNGDQDKVLANIKRRSPEMYGKLAESIARQRWSV
jgi:hypothetical protein